MAKIVLNDAAPSDDTLAFSFAGVEEAFQAPYETDNREAISNALAHPWLEVEYDAEDVVDPDEFDTRLRPEDDALSAVNDHSNDPDAVRAEIERRRAERGDVTPLAVEPTLDQDEPVKEGPVAVTLAADETDEDGDSY
jgi:hypothetical protein